MDTVIFILDSRITTLPKGTRAGVMEAKLKSQATAASNVVDCPVIPFSCIQQILMKCVLCSRVWVRLQKCNDMEQKLGPCPSRISIYFVLSYCNFFFKYRNNFQFLLLRLVLEIVGTLLVIKYSVWEFLACC